MIGFGRVIFPIFAQASEPIGYFAIDSTVNGYCCGGVRMMPDLSPSVVSELAHLMTLKYGFVGLPMGGAKAGIIGDPEMPIEQKRELLAAFGRGLKPHLRKWHYMPWTDMGTTDADIRTLAQSAGIKDPGLSRPSSSGGFTGLSVAVAAVEAARFRQMGLSGLTLAVEGFGKVGSAVARELLPMGVKLVALSTSRGAVYSKDGFDIDHLLKLGAESGSNLVNTVERGELIEKAKLLELDVDILSPCAGPFSINESNAGRIAARIVSPGANLPFSSEVQRTLHDRGVLCIPDYVANAGGVLAASMDSAGAGGEFTRRFITTRFAHRVSDLIRTANREGITLDDCARRLAANNFSRAKAKGEKSRVWLGILAFAPHLYSRGLIPRTLLRAAFTRYFERAVLLPNA